MFEFEWENGGYILKFAKLSTKKIDASLELSV